MAGGLLASAWVNARAAGGDAVGFAIAVPVALAHAGGMAAVTAAPGVPSTFADFFYSAGARSGWTFLLLLGPAFVISPGLLQKAYGAASERAIRVGIGGQALVQGVFAFLPPLLGMIGRATHPGLTDLNVVLPTVLIEQLPVALGALALAAVYSAEVSTCDAILFMLATSAVAGPLQALSEAVGERRGAAARRPRRVGGRRHRRRPAGAAAAHGDRRTRRCSIRCSASACSCRSSAGCTTRRAGTPEALAAIAAGVGGALAMRWLPHPLRWWLDPGVVGLAAAASAFMLMFALRRPVVRGVRLQPDHRPR